MSSNHCEVSAYLETGDLQRIADALESLCGKSGMPQDGLRFAVLPGKPGWAIVKSWRSDAWGTRIDDSGTIFFHALCDAVGARGIVIELRDSDPWANLLIECDGKGAMAISGYYTEDGNTMDYHGIALDAEESFDGQVRFSLCSDLACAAYLARGNFGLEECQAIAADLGGECGKRYWSNGYDGALGWDVLYTLMEVNGPLPIPGAKLLSFSSAEPAPWIADRIKRGCLDLGNTFEEWDDIAQAIYWFERAADAGELEAAIKLDDMYRFGLGVARDEAKADAWRKRAFALK